jgi:hypothetical protein
MKPWGLRLSFKDKKLLYQKYILERKSTIKIGRELGCGHLTIWVYLKKFGIKLRHCGAQKGIKFSEEHKRKMRENHADVSGEKNPNYGRVAEKNPAWKGGHRRRSDGRIEIYKPEHPYANNRGCVLRSRLVMEEKLGRYLNPLEIIHHENEKIDDDRPENLALFESGGKHTSFHHKMRNMGQQ